MLSPGHALFFSLLLTPAAAAQSLTFDIDRPVRTIAAEGGFVLSGAGSGAVSVWAPGCGWTDITGPTTVGRGISSDGTTILAGDDVTGGFVWERGVGWSSIPGPGLRGPLHLSSDGDRVVARDDEFTNNPRSYVWDRTTGTVSILSRPPVTGRVTTEAVDADGDVIVGTAGPPLGSRATIWDQSGEFTLIDTVRSQALGVSSNGQWVTGQRTIGGLDFPFRWSQSTGVQVLPTLEQPAAMNEHSPHFISDDGSVIAGNYGSTELFGLESTAYISDAGSTATRFRDVLLQRGGPDLGPAIAIRGMSADGERFVVEAGGSSYWVDLDAVVSSGICVPAVPNSTGAPATVVALGYDAIADRVLELRGASLPPGQAVLPATSMMESFVPMAGGSAGNLCLGGAIGRFPIGFVDGAGSFELGVDITALPAGQGTVSAMAGQDWFFQLWFRDGSSSNFSEAAKVTFR